MNAYRSHFSSVVRGIYADLPEQHRIFRGAWFTELAGLGGIWFAAWDCVWEALERRRIWMEP